VRAWVRACVRASARLYIGLHV